MTSLAALVLAGKDWLWPVVGAWTAGAVFITWSYFRSPAPRGVRVACASLKLLGLTLLLACLLEPMRTGQRAKPGANFMAIVADNSRSMALQGQSDAEARGTTVRRFLSGEKSDWRKAVSENFQIRGYLADTRLRSTQDFQELDFQGQSSLLTHSLTTLRDRSRGHALAGVFLFTDGVATEPQDSLTTLEGLPPVYPVIAGAAQPARDVGITGSSVSQTSFEDAPVTIQANVTASGFASEEITGTLTLVDPAAPAGEEKAIATQTLKAPAQGEKLVFRFQTRPEKTGVLFYRFRTAPAQKANEKEATLANNETIVTVDRGSGKRRVLYVSGRPNWEYKFLNRAVKGDDQTQLVALIRVARREAKFEFRGRAGESSNPLFRGFGNQSPEEVERYDQPVVVRLETEDEHELRGGFPKTPEELFRYHAIILDDLEAEFFTADQMMLLQRFVAERGGGLLMLGGAESLAEGKFVRTPVGDMLPVYLDRTAQAPVNAQLRLMLTREGWLEPWIRLRPNEAEEKKRLADTPHFDVLNRTGSAKPAAVVAATVTDGRAEYPAIVTQRFGRGRTAAMLIGDLWHAGMGEETQRQDLERAWRQMVRWLVADVPEPIELRTEPGPEQAVRIQARIRDKKFQPVDNAAITLSVQPHGKPGAPVTLTAEASPQDPGLYEAVYVPRESGGYSVSAAVKDETGASLGQAQTGWTTDFAAAEFQSLAPNRGWAEALARKTGGRVLSPEELESFVKNLSTSNVPIPETWTRPLWHTPVLFLFALACLVGEWGLRRTKGLA